ncbi:FUSC family protein [Pseudoxanthomonas dokdonensis]|uniref:Membrane protein n=1 Tax=Pseudoxanthomonas dokdonensis TaxID=344882 RepID=A0A0R0CXT2_9GAMM|nr:FUSC family protein [Pseudoxanthomonas dokdonensis]KRG70625.1 membrane protein [Pseudoxanthomonas dokdonensis]
MLRTLLRLKPREVPVRVALRNTAAVMLPLVLGIALDQTSAGLAVASGALNTMFTDLPGPYALRMRRMAAAALAAGLAASLGILIGLNTLPLLLAVFVMGCAGGLLVALGPIAARVGLTSIIMFLICAHMQLPASRALPVALLIASGGLLQMLMAVAAWPLQRYRPERFAMADLLQQLALTARTRPEGSAPSPSLQAAQDTLVMLHGEHRASGMAVDAFRIMAQVCERLRIDLLSLIDVHERLSDNRARETIELLLKQSALVLDDLADALRAPHAPAQAKLALEKLPVISQALAEAAAAARQPRDVRLLRIAQARVVGLSAQLRALLRNSYWAGSRGELRAQKAEARLPKALRPGAPWQTLRANIKLSSVAFRHALRCGVCLVIATALERSLAIPHGYWIPMTAAIVLKPDFGGTLSFGALRVAGTFAGLLITTVLAHYAMDGVLVRLLLMAALCVGFRLTAQINYGIGVALLTGMLVLLLSFEGMAPGEAVQARVIATTAGSALAMIAYALWPTWEGKGARFALASLVQAYQTHLDALFAGRVDALDETRSASRVARTNTQASLERLRNEPRRRNNRSEAEFGESLLANVSRLMRAPLSLEAMMREGARLPAQPALLDFAEATHRSLAAIAAVLQGQAKAADIPAVRPHETRLAAEMNSEDADEELLATLLDTCDRIANSCDTLRHLLRRGNAQPGSPAVATPADAADGRVVEA